MIHESTMRFLIALFMASLLWLGGCAARPVEGELQLDAAEYQAVFDAAVQTLRDHRFVLDRVDPRLGVITTQPRPLGTAVEPWRGLHGSAPAALESTLHSQRRVVRVEFRPVALPEDLASARDEAEAGAGGAGWTGPGPFEPGRVESGRLRVEVQTFLERAHRPNRRIESQSLRFSTQTVDPQLLARGVPLLFWEPVARDPWFEQRLIGGIAARAPGAVGTP